MHLCGNTHLRKCPVLRPPYPPWAVRRATGSNCAFYIEGMLRAHIKPFLLLTIHLLVVEKDIQPPFWSPIPSFGVLLSQPAPSGARLRHFYFPSFIARRYFLVPGVNGIPHRQKNQYRHLYHFTFYDSTRSTLQSLWIAHNTYNTSS
jgi:hypothetical protein